MSGLVLSLIPEFPDDLSSSCCAFAAPAAHLAALLLPPTLYRLYIARDADAAGDKAFAALSARATAAGIEVLALSPQRDDFNDDLQARGVNALRAALRPQLAPQDTERAEAVGKGNS
ncbi:toprim domain-containing protein [Phaeovulum veldkampii]|uniref:toprim domain-containing protein n=1 Tax=Phaeovulum veldkampii TaxID=33049 RepID=UPI0010D763AA|nr:toprim domain-containing protein [Phaeovulum veldkampii]TDQ53503.1 Toprim domain-containing protein [Phaeovulum veldkampii DSM 11550]